MAQLNEEISQTSLENNVEYVNLQIALTQFYDNANPRLKALKENERVLRIAFNEISSQYGQDNPEKIEISEFINCIKTFITNFNSSQSACKMRKVKTEATNRRQAILESVIKITIFH